jgi:probable HAF family extracellular repeat protein
VTGRGWEGNPSFSSRPFRTTATGDLSDPAADLGLLPGFVGGEGRAINASGVVVGALVNATGGNHAFVYDAQMRDLNDLIPAGSGWVLATANGINDFGWIVGAGTLNGEGRSFLLTPIPEPSALLLAGAAAAGTWAVRRARTR